MGIIYGQKRVFRKGGVLGEGVFRERGAGGRGKAQKNHWSKNMTPTWV